MSSDPKEPININTIQAVVWHFTDNWYMSNKHLELVNSVNAYTGPDIPDNGYVRILDNYDEITFYFTVMQPIKGDIQSFFAYKFDVKKHVHEKNGDYLYDNENHWYECICGKKIEEETHDGGEANCKELAKCEKYKQFYGVKNLSKHTGETKLVGYKDASEDEEGYTGDVYCKDCDKLLEQGRKIILDHKHKYKDFWTSNQKKHWHECECGSKVDEKEHKFVENICSICGIKRDIYEQIPETGDTINVSGLLAMLIASMAILLGKHKRV